jgi:hypothetical protein
MIFSRALLALVLSVGAGTALADADLVYNGTSTSPTCGIGGIRITVSRSNHTVTYENINLGRKFVASLGDDGTFRTEKDGSYTQGHVDEKLVTGDWVSKYSGRTCTGTFSASL